MILAGPALAQQQPYISAINVKIGNSQGYQPSMGHYSGG